MTTVTSTRGAFLLGLGAASLSGCGGGPGSAPWVAPAAAALPPQAQATATITQWGVQMDRSDDTHVSLPLLQQLRPSWLHVAYDSDTGDAFAALAQTLNCGVFFMTSTDIAGTQAAAAKYAAQRVAWDILNEPDVSTTQPTVSPGDYVTLATSMSAAIKSVAPNHLVCAASCSGNQSSNPTYYRSVFSGGLLNLQIDAIGFHPYGGGNGANGDPPFTNIANAYKGLVVQYGGHQQVWNSEWGQSSGTEAQGPALQSWADSLRGITPVAIWLGFRDSGVGGTRESAFGLVDINYNPKAVFATAVSEFNH